jgi:hypothetical protein
MKTLDATSRAGGAVAVVVLSAVLSGCYYVPYGEVRTARRRWRRRSNIGSQYPMQPHPVQWHQMWVHRRTPTSHQPRPSSFHLRITPSRIRTTAGPHGGDRRCRWASAIGAAAVTAGAAADTGVATAIEAVMATGVGADTQGVVWAAVITGAVAEVTDVRIDRQDRCARVQQFPNSLNLWVN